MRIYRILCLGALARVAVGSAEFFQVRRKMHQPDMSRTDDPPGKYFHESSFDVHYDGRFGRERLEYLPRRRAMRSLVQTFLATFADIGVETWLMHGSLLGWWWNKQALPWDTDVDMEVMEPSMHFLAAYYNMSVFHFKTTRLPEGRDYMLEVNPNWANSSQDDTLNTIDARWIDTETGLFIDITTARYNYSHPGGEGMITSKDGHEFRDTYLLPLLETTFEDLPVKIPYKYKDMLISEYGERALINTEYHDHAFDHYDKQWIPGAMLFEWEEYMLDLKEDRRSGARIN